ncbi:hypothetical protein SAMN02746041_00446 [Desulfacinum hydrothermale DSM 13146]|uniref:Uncharacterized protein n=1 Tax=Desulfacinum hydrothermale DSM 13146 TaxID=1121390 RepID=A0A1W1X2R8_9BACT|nr:hypothetical protein [Desulfacinum hydrothermale]SMC18018.1 hypothetical protein SAMN02746041_00446 [Desulfacinum hydrothermale DSM 13146]
MERSPFSQKEIPVLTEAIRIAEELIGDRFRISTSDWKRYRYDIQSLKDLRPEEITDSAFAQIRRYARQPHEKLLASKHGDYFKICLQDHVIRRALARDPHIRLLPLATYIVTHELIHVVRFARFLQSFDAPPRERNEEEIRVHHLTAEFLGPLRMQGMPEVLQAFQDCRNMETFISQSSQTDPADSR